MPNSRPKDRPDERLLMGPGPSSVPHRVLEALSWPTVGHLDPEFIAIMDEIRELLQYAFQTRSPHVLTLSAPGSAGMESTLVNLVEPGDSVAVCINGVFGQRMAEVARRAGARVTELEFEWGGPVAPHAVEVALAKDPHIGLLAVVHAETSTGAASDVEALAGIARRHDCLVLVDAVTSLGGMPLAMDDWGLDAVYSGTQKCLSCPPGLSPVALSPRAWSRIESRRRPPQSWFLDFTLLNGYWGSGSRRAYHHTAPVNSLYAWREALRMLREEGLEAAWERHRRQHRALAAGLGALGLRFVVEGDVRLPQLNAVWVPDPVPDEAAVRRRLLEEFRIEIGAGLGDFAGRVWRIGLMGHNARSEAVERCLDALGQCLAEYTGIDPGAGVAAGSGIAPEQATAADA